MYKFLISWIKYMETLAWEFPPETTSGNSPSLRPRQQTHYTKENDAKDFLLESPMERKKKRAGGREYTRDVKLLPLFLIIFNFFI